VLDLLGKVLQSGVTWAASSNYKFVLRDSSAPGELNCHECPANLTQARDEVLAPVRGMFGARQPSWH
jgi:hypothetical protein